MDQFSGDQRRLPGIDSCREAALQHRSLIPRNRMQRKVSDSRTLRRERKLLQNGKSMREHFRPREISEPKTEIKWIGHNSLESLLAAHQVHGVFLNSKLYGPSREPRLTRRTRCGGVLPGLHGLVTIRSAFGATCSQPSPSSSLA